MGNQFSLSCLTDSSLVTEEAVGRVHAQAERLGEVLRSFKIAGDIHEVKLGPVITSYEFMPGPGIRGTRLVTMAADLGLAMRTNGVRVVVGDTLTIEVPNPSRDTVRLSELLKSNAWLKSDPDGLALALGKTIEGEPIVRDLTQMPHLLIAGATGSGKSVCLNSLLLSLLYDHGPDSLCVVLIDPKRLELLPYSGLPHLYGSVVTTPEEAEVVLEELVSWMDLRYRALAAVGVRDLQAYNQKITPRLPRIVIVIDELADLMMISPKEVKHSLVRLAQVGRAAGLHLLTATQRPSVDVVAGILKANFPERLCFRTSSATDSQVVLGETGAEELLGKGDGLLMIPGRVMRVHAPLVTGSEVIRAVADIRARTTTGKAELAPEAVQREWLDERSNAVGAACVRQQNERVAKERRAYR